jgi:propionyl-CoA carboxylase beta chain
MARHYLSYMPSNNVENPPFIKPDDDLARMDESLNSMVPIDASEPYIMHQVIEKIIDQGTFLEIQPDWARNAIVGLARIGGHSVGIVAQEPAIMAGVIDIDAADKMTRFVRMCDCFNIPLVTFVDSPGFLPGIAQEHGGIIRHGANCCTLF